MRVDITMEDLEKIYDEVERRVQIDVNDGCFDDIKQVQEYRNALMQGVYSALRILSNDWVETVLMIGKIEDDAYWKRLGYPED